jgi:hypothetical protein
MGCERRDVTFFHDFVELWFANGTGRNHLLNLEVVDDKWFAGQSTRDFVEAIDIACHSSYSIGIHASGPLGGI